MSNDKTLVGDLERELREMVQVPLDPRGLLERCVAELKRREWRPISECKPEPHKSYLLGYKNALGNFVFVRGEWITQEQIDGEWEETDFEEGWYESAYEADDTPNCWPITPTHYMFVPSPNE